MSVIIQLYEINIELDRTIKPKKRHRNNSYGVGYNPSKKDEEELLYDLTSLLSKDDIKFLEEIKDDKNVNVSVSMKLKYATKNKSKIGKPKLTTSDIDNTMKELLDSINGEFFFDDRVVFELYGSKFYDIESKSIIKITYYK